LNQAVFNLIWSFSRKSVLLDDVAILIAQYLPYLMVAAVLVFAFYYKDKRKRWFLLLEAAIAIILSRGIITELIRFIYYHPRPFDFYKFTPLIAESGASFPSGHAAFFFALAMTLYFWDKRWAMVYFVLSLFIGAARVYVGVHWPLDILGGIIVGTLSAYFVHMLLRPYFDRLFLKKEEVLEERASVN